MKNNVLSLKLNNFYNIKNEIRSFVCRNGRITKGQKYALDKFWSFMGIDYQLYYLDFKKLFNCSSSVIMEIGFGMGESFVTTAKLNPEKNFLGIEVYRPGVGACLSRAYEAGVKNIRVICHDAVEVVEYMIKDNTLMLVQLFFPDPWHKNRHNKRRIVQTPFIELIERKIISGGILHIATDWKEYGEHILNIVLKVDSFYNLSPSGDYIIRPNSRPFTKFEYRGQKLGNNVYDLMFKKK